MRIKIDMFIPILITIFTMFSSCAQRTDLGTYGLHGKVKTYTEREYKAEKVSEEWMKGDIKEGLHHRNFFDSEGNHVRREILKKDDSVLEKAIILKENDKLVGEIIYNSDGEVKQKVVINHISRDEIEYIYTDKNGEKSLEVKIWLENGKYKRQELQFFEKGEKKSSNSALLEYDMYGNVSIIKRMNINGHFSYAETYKYLEFDDYNNWTKRLCYTFNENEKPSKVVIREYEYY